MERTLDGQLLDEVHAANQHGVPRAERRASRGIRRFLQGLLLQYPGSLGDARDLPGRPELALGVQLEEPDGV